MKVTSAVRNFWNAISLRIHEERSGSFVPPTPPSKSWLTDPDFYRTADFVYVAITTLAENAARVPFNVSQTARDGKEIEATGAAADRLRTLLNRPNQDMSGYDLRELTQVQLEAWGNAFWLIESTASGLPISLSPLRPSSMSVSGSNQRGKLVDHYNYMLGDGKILQIPVESIIHFKYANPFDDLWGLAPLTSARLRAEGMVEAQEYNREFYFNAAEGRYIIQYEGALNENMRKRLEENLQQSHGRGQRFKPLLLEGGASIQTLNLPPKDMEFVTGQKMDREAILAVFGVPPLLAGILDSATYNNAREQRLTFWQEKMFPKLRKRDDAINLQLTPLLRNPTLNVRSDLSVIQPMLEDFEARALSLQTLAGGAPILSINRVREMLGEPAILGGDILVGNPTMIPMLEETQAARRALQDLTQDVKTLTTTVATIESTPELSAPPITALSTHPTSDDVVIPARAIRFLRRFEGSLFGVQRRIMKTIRKLAAEQMAEVVAKINRLGKNITPAQLKDAVDDFIFDEKIWHGRFVSALEPEVVGSMEAGAAEKATTFNMSASFDVTNPRATAYLNKFSAQRVKNINDRTATALRATLSEGYTEGESIRELVRRIDSVEDKLRGSRAFTIARTETTGGANFGAVELYQEAGIEKQEWLSSLDDRVRGGDAADEFSHIEVNGQVTKVGQYFDVSGEQMAYPGDASGSAGNVVNCRCTVIPIME